MTNNIIFLPQSQNEIIDLWKLKEKPSEFVWVDSFGCGLTIIPRDKLDCCLFQFVSSARTLEELLALAKEYKEYRFVYNMIEKVWVAYDTYFSYCYKHKDPKQAVFQMLEWCRDNNYLKGELK